MRRIVFILIISSFLLNISSAGDYFYYMKNEKVMLNINPYEFTIKLKKRSSEKEISDLISGLSVSAKIISSNCPFPGNYFRLILDDPSERIILFDRFKNMDEVDEVYPVFDMGMLKGAVSDQFIIRLNAPVADIYIQQLNEKFLTQIVYEFSGTNKAYLLKRSKNCTYSIFELVDLYYQNLPLEYSMPDFFIPIQLHSIPSDPYFSEQYYLKNTISPADINVVDAWDISKGSSAITVAVIDQGVEAHEDLPEERVLEGKDFYIFRTDDIPNPEGNQAHGMCCAGIIAASHNSVGIAGIVPECNILPVKIFGNKTNSWPNSVALNKAAINYAWYIENADVLSNSWGYADTSLTNPALVPIKEEIENALTFGRNGKGTIVVFSAGNTGRIHGKVTFPANIPGVLAVGAIDKYNIFWDYSPQDTELDVVAPSGDLSQDLGAWIGDCDPKEPTHRLFHQLGDVWTTDIAGMPGYNPGYFNVCMPNLFDEYTFIGGPSYFSYTGHFGGTSAASPQVSGVSALLLSINPNLTVTDVNSIIKNTAVDLGPPGWDNRYGFGRINAYQALLLADSYANKSISSSATAQNSGRRLAWNSSSGWYHLVFSSGGEIFYRRKSQGSYNWADPIRLSDGEGNHDYPSITEKAGRVYVIWQQKTGSATYKIHYAASMDHGVSWPKKYVLNTTYLSADPLPVIKASAAGDNSLMVVFRYGTGAPQGLKSYWTYYTDPSSGDWDSRTITLPSSPSAHQYPALDGAAVSGNTMHTLAYANSSTKHVYYCYYHPALYEWEGFNNMSIIVPGSNYTHSTPTLSVIPNSAKVHLAWYRKYGSGSSSYDHVIVHRKSTGYSTWPNEYHLTYYEGQRRPSISALADNKVHLLFQHYNGDLVYKSSFNGSYWGGPVSVSSQGQHPSVSSGQSSARYVWTEGLNSPYEIKLSTEQLSKEADTDKRDFYSRSIAWLDSSGNYLELRVNEMSLKRKDQIIRRLDFVDISLDTFELKPANAWDLLTSGAEYFPADAESVLVSFTLIAENRDKVAEEGEQKAFVAIRLLTDTGQLLHSKQAETLSMDQSTEASLYTCALALDEVKSALGSVKM